MFFKLPGRSASGAGGFPTQPRKLRQWIEDLPLVNMGEASRQFFEGLKQLNASDLTPSQRLELMEIMLPMAENVLGHLHRHFINRTLPLSERTHRIEELYRVVLTELASGYTRAANDMTEAGRPREKELALAIHRAMHFVGESIVNRWRLYETPPPGAWLGIGRLYLMAEQHGLQDRPMPNGDREGPGEQISQTFKRLCLLAQAHPLSLRLGEADRVAEFLDTRTDLALITPSAVPDSQDGVHVINLDDDEGPGYFKVGDAPEGPTLRTINLSPLAREIRERLQSPEKPYGLDLSTDLLRRILDGWTRSAKRRFSRASRDDEVNVALGLASICATINREIEERNGPSTRDRGIDQLSLQSIGDDLRADHVRDDLFLSPAGTLKGANAWDMVARGNIITDSYTGHPPAGNTITAVGLGARDTTQEPWQVVNVSAGGFCLRWQGQQACRAQVGELIGLREKEGNQYQWRVGMIRWMLNKYKRGLEIGVQVLAPKTMLVALSPSRLGRPVGKSTDALLLPAIKTIQQRPTLLTTVGRFRVGDEALVTLSGRVLRIKLAGMSEQTSLFVQYHYTTLGKGEPEPEPDQGPGSPDVPEKDAWSLI